MVCLLSMQLDRPPVPAGGKSLVVLIGSSKNIWPRFISACGQDPGLLATANPLDTYVENSVNSATQTISEYVESLFSLQPDYLKWLRSLKT